MKTNGGIRSLLLFFVMFCCGCNIGLCRQIVLTQEMINSQRTSFVIKQDYTLNKKTIRVPKNVKLVFKGGSIDNGVIVGTNTLLDVQQQRAAFGLQLTIAGSWVVSDVYDRWFEFDKRPQFIANGVIRNILALSNENTNCHIHLDEDRTYYFELPYRGSAKLGDSVSFYMKNGKKKRRYAEIYNDKYSFLRIFTIPSNTHLTVNNRLQMLPTNQGAYFVFWEYDKQNVTVDGKGSISGENLQHRYDSPYAGKYYFGEWGMIFECVKCRNFIFRDITISDAFGDCLVFRGSHYTNETGYRWADGLLMDNVKILRARRNGVNIAARNVSISHCHFEGCGTDKVKGTMPKSAIDFEPDKIKNYNEIGNQNVVMSDCTFKNNYFDVASYRNNLMEYGKIATTIKNCVFTAPLKIEGTYWMRFENCRIPSFYNTKDKSKSLLLYSRYLEFDRCVIGRLDTNLRSLLSSGNNKFTNCTVKNRK